jgi:L(+)-tartrate dehydratase beta subunit
VKRIVTLPVTAGELDDLRIGDTVYLTGRMVTGRDDVHHRVVREGRPCPAELRGLALFHAGPIIREEPGKNILISIGPTSSIRMEDDEAAFIGSTRVKVIVGKGGMGPKTAAACKEYGAIHCVFPGGCAVTAAVLVEEIEGVYWRELGMPECLWVLRVREFGPLIVTIDTLGNNLFGEHKKRVEARKEEVMAPIIEGVQDWMSVE